jgi:filamentous hemagglutinin family protein
MQIKSKRLALLILAAVLPCGAQVPSSVVRDGTVGNPDISLQPVRSGAGMIEIGEQFGARPGNGVNLFHSFTSFDVGVGDRALFTAAADRATLNIIARVTGGSASQIYGTIASSVPGAALFILNPRGILFGASARIDVPGSFHASTASSLRMLADDSGGALTFTPDVRLAMAHPIDFGFLGQPAPLTVNGSLLQVTAGSTLTLLGGSLAITGPTSGSGALTCSAACLSAPGGTIQLGAVAGATRVPVNLSGWSPLAGTGGTISLTGRSLFSVNGAGRGAFVLRGGSLVADRVEFRANTTSTNTQPFKAIDLQVAGDLLLDRVTFGATGAQRGGDIAVTANNIALARGAAITTGPCTGCATGTGGAISLTASEVLGMSAANGGAIITTLTSSGRSGGNIALQAREVSVDGGRLRAITTGAGQAGTVTIEGEVITLLNGALVESATGAVTDGGSTSGSTGGGGGGGGGGGSGGGGSTGPVNTGNGGNVVLTAGRTLTLQESVDVGANSNSAGNAGNVRLVAPEVFVLNGARVGSVAGNSGNGGNISIEGSRSVVVAGTDQRPTLENRGSRITASSRFTATGNAGSIQILTGGLRLADGARVSSSTSGLGQGGSILLDASDGILLTGARGDGSGTSVRASTEVEGTEATGDLSNRLGNAGPITVRTPLLTLAPGTEIVSSTSLPGAGGRIDIDAAEIHLTGARIEALSTGTGSGNAGNVRVGLGVDATHALRDLMLDASDIATSAEDAGGGDITVDGSGSLRMTRDSGIDASDTGGFGGNVRVSMTRDIIVGDDSRILARAAIPGGDGGVISLTTDAFIRSPASQVIAANRVVVNSPETDLQGNLRALPAAFQDTVSQFRELCAARAANERSGSLTAVTNPGLTLSPELSLLAFEQTAGMRPGAGAMAATTAAARAFADGRFSTAATLWAQAVALAGPAAPDRSDLLRGLAEALQAVGRFEESLGPLQAALAVARATGDQGRIAAALGSEANARMALGNAARAEELLTQALATAQDQALRARLLNNQGNLLLQQGRQAPAIERYLQSATAAGAGDQPLLAAYALANAARAAAMNGDDSRALELAAAAVAAVAEGSDSYAAIATLINAGVTSERIAGLRGKLAATALLQAHRAFTRGRSLAERLGDQRDLAYALGGLARLYRMEARYAEALSLSERALASAEQADEGASLYRWHWQIGAIQAAQGDIPDAVASYQRAMLLADATRQEGRPQYGATAALYRRDVAPVYQDLVGLLLASSDAAGDAAVRSRLLFEARNVVERLKAADLRDYFRDECVAELNARAVPLEEIGGDTAIVYPVLLPDRLELLVSTAAVIRHYTVPRSRDDVTALVQQLRQQLENRTTREYLPAAQALYELLIRPMEADLAAARIESLVFIPDGVLYQIPISVLHDGRRHLVEKFAISVTPTLRLIAPRPLQSSKLKVLLAGNGGASGSFAPLPHVTDEIMSIRDLIGGTVFLDQRFDTSAFQRHVTDKQPNVIHVASHAVFSGDANASYLLTHDGRITMSELQRLVAQTQFREPLELLTLSACETAAGDERAALGLSGTAIRAGARSVLGSLWAVSDEAASQMLVEFYRGLSGEGESLAQSLARAQRTLLADPRFSHPYYWSAFELIGNWL